MFRNFMARDAEELKGEYSPVSIIPLRNLFFFALESILMRLKDRVHISLLMLSKVKQTN